MKSILSVEDNEEYRTLMSHILAEAGYVVDAVESDGKITNF